MQQFFPDGSFCSFFTLHLLPCLKLCLKLEQILISWVCLKTLLQSCRNGTRAHLVSIMIQRIQVAVAVYVVGTQFYNCLEICFSFRILFEYTHVKLDEVKECYVVARRGRCNILPRTSRSFVVLSDLKIDAVLQPHNVLVGILFERRVFFIKLLAEYC